jgi:hypothetical protein
MQYTCTIYNHDYTVGGVKGFTGTEPVFDAPLAHVVVSGGSLREAAARAYVKCVGRERARRMRRNRQARRDVIAQETSCKAIAASLRKTARRIGECYELDNFLEGWFIKVEPALASPRPSPRSRRLRFSLPLFRQHLSSSPSPN